eukprot:scaffold112868_cov31-Tisochrysis_lutea.AAC.2
MERRGGKSARRSNAGPGSGHSVWSSRRGEGCRLHRRYTTGSKANLRYRMVVDPYMQPLRVDTVKSAKRICRLKDDREVL